jgi:hypothetical protein
MRFFNVTLRIVIGENSSVPDMVHFLSWRTSFPLRAGLLGAQRIYAPEMVLKRGLPKGSIAPGSSDGAPTWLGYRTICPALSCCPPMSMSDLFDATDHRKRFESDAASAPLREFWGGRR